MTDKYDEFSHPHDFTWWASDKESAEIVDWIDKLSAKDREILRAIAKHSWEQGLESANDEWGRHAVNAERVSR